MRNLDYNQKEDKFLISRIVEGYNRYQRTGKSFSSPFLDERKFLLLSSYLKNQKIAFSIYEANPLASKKVIYFGSYDDFVTSFRFSNVDGKIKHADVLGSLFALGLSVDVIGDIFIEQDAIYFSVLTKVVPLLKQELRQVSKYPISLEESSIVLKEDHEDRFSISISSMRIDVILSRLIPCSRSKSTTLLKEGCVFLFYQELKENAYLLEEGDIISIRHVGKFRIGKKEGSTKSGKIILEIIKYR